MTGEGPKRQSLVYDYPRGSHRLLDDIILIYIFITSSRILFPNQVTFTGTRGWDVVVSFGAHS